MGKILRKTRWIILIVCVSLLLSSCPELFTGSLNSPMDPDANDYQGFFTVTNPDDVEPHLEEGSKIIWPRFAISNVIGGEVYHLQIATDRSFSSSSIIHDDATIQSNVLTLTQDLGLVANRTYFWRGRAQLNGTFGSWTDVHSFAFRSISGVSPGNQTVTHNMRSSLSWDAVENAISYEIQVAESESEVASAVRIQTTSPTYTFSEDLVSGERRFWRVRAKDASGLFSVWADINYFYIRKLVSAGTSHTMILRTDGSLWGTGGNSSGQLGDGTTTDRSTPVQVMTDVAAVSAGDEHTMILKTDGTLWGTGRNSSGQLGDGTTTDRSTPVQIMTGVAAVSAGSAHTMILKTDGTLWGTGSHRSGRLGDGTWTNRSTPVQIMTGVAAVSAGSEHTMILKTDGTLWGTGNNGSGQLGDGTTATRFTPVQIMTGVAAVSAGSEHTMILKTDGTLWGTGSNGSGRLGDGTMSIWRNRSTPVQIMTGVAAVSAGSEHTMILKTDGTLWGTGNNRFGRLGDGTTGGRSTPVQVMTGVAAVSAGSEHTMILKTDGTLWGTGNNGSGRLGDGTTTNRSFPVQIR